MEFLYEYGLFLAKTLTFVIAIIAIIATAGAFALKNKEKKGHLEITDLSDEFEHTVEELEHHLLSKAQLKEKQKQQKKQAKLDKNKDDEVKPKLFVLDFKGSIDAKEVASLREEISAVLMTATKNDEVLVKVESGGGMVHGYGLAASQLQRIRDKQIPLTISVDKVAASGGYMMASVANKIIAAPFAIVGSIGVIAQIPNFNKVLKKHDIEFEQMTAGEFKRTLTMFGENTDKAREKFQQELELTHELFKQHIANVRPNLDLTKVATGEHWFGLTALELGLIDEIKTSDDYLFEAAKSHQIVQIKYAMRKGLAEKFAKAASITLENTIGKLWQQRSFMQ